MSGSTCGACARPRSRGVPRQHVNSPRGVVKNENREPRISLRTHSRIPRTVHARSLTHAHTERAHPSLTASLDRHCHTPRPQHRCRGHATHALPMCLDNSAMPSVVQTGRTKLPKKGKSLYSRDQDFPTVRRQPSTRHPGHAERAHGARQGLSLSLSLPAEREAPRRHVTADETNPRGHPALSPLSEGCH